MLNILSKQYPINDIYCLFTDTFIEDDDLYRFLIETAQYFYKVDLSKQLNKIKDIPSTHLDIGARKEFLKDMASQLNELIPNFNWINYDYDVWELFEKVEFIGNSRVAPCSQILKQRCAKRFVKKNFKAVDTILYLGIDWTEEHRTKAPIENWNPYIVKFPLCDPPYIDKNDIFNEIKRVMELPSLYSLGFAHNNCGGFCVRAGQGHFANLLKTKPELFNYHENKEQELIRNIGKDVTILRKTKNKKRYNYSLKELREDLQSKNCDIDLTDVGGCGCFVTDDEIEIL